MSDNWNVVHLGLVQALIKEILDNGSVEYTNNNTKIESVAKINGREFKYFRIVNETANSFKYEIVRDQWSMSFNYDQTDPEFYRQGSEKNWTWTGVGDQVEFEKDMVLIKMFLTK